MKYVYSYRLTCFDGSAPCIDAGLFTLAVCKRDMRRVIGNLLKDSDANPEIWVLGIVGKTLLKNSIFSKKYNSDDVLYVAKITAAEEYGTYFSSKEDRKDKIYVPCNSKTEFTSCSLYFRHNGGNIHSDHELQRRDWDLIHEKSGKYVLKTDLYSFCSKCESGEITALAGDLLAKGVGHKKIVDPDENLIQLLNGIVAGNEEHGISNLPGNIVGTQKCSNGCEMKKR